jgi:flagellar assembly factor FliW
VITADTPIETRFGSFPVRTDEVVTMPDGLPGFETCHRFVIVASPALEPFVCLQGLEGPRPSFLALDPRLVMADYAATLPPSDRRRLDVQERDTLLWLAFVRLRDEDGHVNLKAPVVINPRRMIGLQLVDGEGPYSADHRLLLD